MIYWLKVGPPNPNKQKRKSAEMSGTKRDQQNRGQAGGRGGRGGGRYTFLGSVGEDDQIGNEKSSDYRKKRREIYTQTWWVGELFNYIFIIYMFMARVGQPLLTLKN